jgi:hypothetical protein
MLGEHMMSLLNFIWGPGCFLYHMGTESRVVREVGHLLLAMDVIFSCSVSVYARGLAM